jgi:hypothetical protein
MATTKTYVLIISEFFPKNHNKSGLPTGFISSICRKNKIHTIRGNYELWEKRFSEISKGNAALSVRVWTGMPYKSTQHEIFSFDITKGIGLQKLKSWDHKLGLAFTIGKKGNVLPIEIDILAHNDGLSKPDFDKWFQKADFSKPMAIIHFTDFRYY